MIIRIFLLAITIQFAFSASAGSVAKPQKYAISQQVGSVCFLSCWYNFELIQKARSEHDGEFSITLTSSKSRLEWFLETAESIALWYKIFRTQSTMAGSAFANFVERVKATSITVKDGLDYIAELDPINQKAGIHHFPHLLLEGSDANTLYSPTDDPLVTIKLDVSLTGHITPNIEVSSVTPIELLGHKMFRIANAMLDENRAFYDFGLYKLMLMAAKVKSDNTVVADSSADRESLEILQFHNAMRKIPNPWSIIDRDYFIEYRVANLFKADATLKTQAEAVVDVFFKTFEFYKVAKGVLGLGAKMKDLPGEEQMLSYYFCQSLRSLSAASIGEEAIVAVLELDAEEVEPVCAMLGSNISQNLKAKFYQQQDVSGGGL